MTSPGHFQLQVKRRVHQHQIDSYCILRQIGLRYQPHHRLSIHVLFDYVSCAASLAPSGQVGRKARWLRKVQDTRSQLGLFLAFEGLAHDRGLNHEQVHGSLRALKGTFDDSRLHRHLLGSMKENGHALGRQTTCIVVQRWLQ